MAALLESGISAGLTLATSATLSLSSFSSRFVLVIIFGFALLRLRFIYLIGVTLLLLAFFSFAVILIIVFVGTVYIDVWSSLLFTLVSLAMCAKASYTMEKHAKQDFLMKRMLQLEHHKMSAEKERADRVLMDLFPLRVRTYIKQHRIVKQPRFAEALQLAVCIVDLDFTVSQPFVLYFISVTGTTTECTVASQLTKQTVCSLRGQSSSDWIGLAEEEWNPKLCLCSGLGLSQRHSRFRKRREMR